MRRSVDRWLLQRGGRAAFTVAVVLLTGLLSLTLRWVGHRAVQQDATQAIYRWEAEFTVNGAALLKFPTRKGVWYILQWEERRSSTPLADTTYRIDRVDGRTLYWEPYVTVGTNFQWRQVTFLALSDQQHVRFLATRAGVLHIRNVSLARCQTWAALSVRCWYCLFGAGVVFALVSVRKWLLYHARMFVTWYSGSPWGIRWALSLGAFLLTYSGVMMPLTVQMVTNAGREGGKGVVWHLLGMPLVTTGLMYAAGWPMSIWLLRGGRRYPSELLLAVGMGFVVLMCSYSMSIIGVRSPVVGLAIVTFVVISWSISVCRGVRPAPPDVGAVAVVLSSVVLLGLLSWPLRYERDVWPSALHNGDIAVYTTESLALREVSARELCQMSLSYAEPSYLAYKADTIRGLPFGLRCTRVSDATEHLVAVLSWLLCTRPEHVLGMYTYCLLPLLLLAGVGAVRLICPMRPAHVLFLVTSLATCFPLIYLSRDGYLNNLHGLMLSLMLVAFGTTSLRSGDLRLATVAGLCGSALLMCFVVIVPLVAMVLIAYAGILWTRWLYLRQYAKLTRAIAALVVMTCACVVGAPHASYYLGYDVWTGAFGAKIFTERPSYPQRLWTLAGGFVADWAAVVGMPVFAYWYQRISALATLGSISAIILWLRARAGVRARAACVALLLVTAGAVLWTYMYDRSRYAYFKNLVALSLVISVCAACAWASLLRKRRRMSIERVSCILLALWMCGRLASMPVAVKVTAPVNTLNEKVASVAAAAQFLPHDARISIDVNDYLYTPLLHAYLRQFTLRSEHPVGYSVRTFPGKDYAYLLSATSTLNLPEVWNNGYYWLYSTNRVSEHSHQMR